jgi:hypothetical protein
LRTSPERQADVRKGERVSDDEGSRREVLAGMVRSRRPSTALSTTSAATSSAVDMGSQNAARSRGINGCPATLALIGCHGYARRLEVSRRRSGLARRL